MKIKKLLFMGLLSISALALAACGAADNKDSSGKASAEYMTIETLNGASEKIDLEVPVNPERIAVMDMASLDILDKLDLGDRIVGLSKGSSIDYLQKYLDDESIINLGTVKEADLEALIEADPQLIFIGGRLAPFYDDLIKIAPVVYLSTDKELGLVKSTSKNALTVASIFSMEDKIKGFMADYDARISTLSAYAKGKNALVGMVNAGGFNLLGNDGRASIIGKEIGFENIGLEAVKKAKEDKDKQKEATSSHGNEASFEVLVSLNPEYIFVMDRDAAIGTEGAKLAKEVMDNELVHMTDAYKNDTIVFLDHSSIWYLAEGGITALGIMLGDLEAGLLG